MFGIARFVALNVVGGIIAYEAINKYVEFKKKREEKKNEKEQH
jgi:hypothetical protein